MRMNAMERETKRQAKNPKAARGSQKKLSAEQAFATLGGVDE